MKHLLAVMLAALYALETGSVAAQSDKWPSKPVTYVVPFAPGGTTDILARIIGQKLSVALGQPVMIENKPGAGGNIGSDAVAKAKPDGYTILGCTISSHAINPSVYAKMPYDAVKDFAPITLIASAPSVLVVHPSLPARTLAEFTALAKTGPGRINYASNGNGSSAQLAAVLYESMAGVRMVHVPYKGLAPALVDLLAGEVQAMFSSVVAIVPNIKAGRLRALAVTGKRRAALLPEVPTLDESGVPGYEAGSWYGILAPAGTPQAIVVKLHEAIARALAQPEVRERLVSEGAEVIGSTPEAFAAHITAELARMGKLIRDAGIRME